MVRELLTFLTTAGLVVLVVSLIIRYRRRRGLLPPDPEQVLRLNTTRHSAVIREILTAYGSGSEIWIDNKSFGPADVPRLLDDWCTNQRIRSTEYFQMVKDGVPIFGWGCSYQDFWANATEKTFVDALQEKGLLRVEHVVSKTARA